MRVLLTNHYTDRERVLEGSPQEVERDLLDMFPMFAPHQAEDRGDVAGLVELIDSTQGWTAEIDGSDLAKGEPTMEDAHAVDPEHPVVQAMLGVHAGADEAADSAAFLAGRPELPEGHLRRQLWAHDDDHLAAALAAHGLVVNDINLKSLKAVMALRKPKTLLNKAEQIFSASAAKHDVQAVTTEGQPAADAVARAMSDQFVFPVRLQGKHSKGSMLAKDEKSQKVFLLKPGSGQQSPAEGAQEQPASQSQREAGFWHVADKIHLGGWLPRADLLIIDGKQYAAMELLPWSYKTLDDKQESDPQLPQRLFSPHLREGVLHRWAVMDYVLGNPDRHANNIMVGPDNEVRLIDHGSALAGVDFDPASDENSFVPAYLRAWAPKAFNKLSPREKMSALPRVSADTAKGLADWLSNLHAEDLDSILHRYGADPSACKLRLAKLKTLALEKPADEAINLVWTGG